MGNTHLGHFARFHRSGGQSEWMVNYPWTVCTWLKELPLIRLMNAQAVLLSIAPRSARITCAQQATLHISMETDPTNERCRTIAKEGAGLFATLQARQVPCETRAGIAKEQTRSLLMSTASSFNTSSNDSDVRRGHQDLSARGNRTEPGAWMEADCKTSTAVSHVPPGLPS